jgi:hypothetical protein
MPTDVYSFTTKGGKLRAKRGNFKPGAFEGDGDKRIRARLAKDQGLGSAKFTNKRASSLRGRSASLGMGGIGQIENH